MNNEIHSWTKLAACAGIDTTLLFGKGAKQRQARELCYSCPVRLQCLAEALNADTDFGVWGGLTERERRALTRNMPHITDWTAWLSSDDALAEEIRQLRKPARASLLRRKHNLNESASHTTPTRAAA